MKIVCSGFYGHGNGGDEAIAMALERYFVTPFKNVTIAFATEMPATDAAQVAADSSFYGRNELISVYDLDTIKEPDIIIVGGGDLSPVYGISQVLHAKESGRVRMIARIGTSAKNDFIKGGEETVDFFKHTMKLFDHISVRDKASYDVIASLGVGVHLGADLAIDVPGNPEKEVPGENYGIVTIRDVRPWDRERQSSVVMSVLKAVKREIGKVYILPFCTGDESFTENIEGNMKDVTVLKGVWRNPRNLITVISNAGYVVSIGRLHPLVFAIGNRVPCFGVTYPWRSGYDKIAAFMEHACLPGRVADWGFDHEQIAAMVHDAIYARESDQEIINVYSGYLKGMMLESLCPIWDAMGVKYGLGLERGLSNGEFVVDDYDDSYYYGARVFSAENKHRIYHPTRGDWGGWSVICNLIERTMHPQILLDVGCGRGWFVRKMLESGTKAEGVDVSIAAYEDCAPGIKKYLKIGRIDDITHRRYDVVTAFDVMEHIYVDEIADAVQALKAAAGKYIVLNICAAPDDVSEYTIKRNQPIPSDLEWLAVSGHVTIRHRSWWKSRLEDDDWKVDEKLIDEWFADELFNFDSWKRHNIIILHRKDAT